MVQSIEVWVHMDSSDHVECKWGHCRYQGISQSMCGNYYSIALKNNLFLQVVNFCDGCDWIDGYPGLSIVQALEVLIIFCMKLFLIYAQESGLPFTGCNSYFYSITTSKPVIKKILQTNNVPTAPFVEIAKDNVEASVEYPPSVFFFRNSDDCTYPSWKDCRIPVYCQTFHLICELWYPRKVCVPW